MSAQLFTPSDPPTDTGDTITGRGRCNLNRRSENPGLVGVGPDRGDSRAKMCSRHSGTKPHHRALTSERAAKSPQAEDARSDQKTPAALNDSHSDG